MNSDNKKNQLHDSLFKEAMAHKAVAKEFLSSHLPTKILKQTNLETLKLEPDSFIDFELGKGQTDLLFSVKYGRQKGFIYLLIEQQTQQDYMMAFRLLKYQVMIISKYLKENPKTKHLPMIYPLVFYNGKQRYTSPRDLWRLYKNPKLAKSFFTGEYQLIEIQKIKDEELRKRLYSGVMELIMKHIYERDILPFVESIEPLLVEISTSNFLYFKAIYKYTLSNAETSKSDKIIEAFKEIAPKKYRKDIMSIADNLRLEGKVEGELVGKLKVAKKMLDKGQSLDFIADVTELPKEELKKLHKKSTQH